MLPDNTSDRRFNNFGAVRNAETLKWLGLAPIFDCGSSIWCSQPTSRISMENAVTPSKPFQKIHVAKIKPAASFEWLSPECLADIDGLCNEIFRQDSYMDEHCEEKLCRAIMVRAETLLGIAHGISQNRQNINEIKLL